MLKIGLDIAKKKIESFIKEVDILSNQTYSGGQEKLYELDTRIRNFINVAFEDADKRRRDYVGLVFGISGERSSTEKQKDYIDDIKGKKRYLVAWLEEIELLQEDTSNKQHETNNQKTPKDEEKKTGGYIAGGIFLIIGILFTTIGLDSGWVSGKITIIIGGIMDLLGGLSIWKPETIGHVLAKYLNGLDKNNNGIKGNQSQKDTKNSDQMILNAGGDIKIDKHYH